GDSPEDQKAKGVISGMLMGGLAGTTLLSAATSSGYTAAAYGAAVGSFAASRFVKDNLSRMDKRRRSAAMIYALDKGVTGTQYLWGQKGSNTRGEITPLDQFSNDLGQVCRRFIEVTIANNQRIEASRNACADARGYWTAE
ncbi:MAG: hypothetical protein AAF352_07670, partial [Pseudomonadota bacterium]